MKKTTAVLFAILLVPVMLASLLVGSAIFDTAKKTQIETYFFQPQNNPDGRPGVPASPADLGADKLLHMLIKRYVTEYFYVIPYTADVDRRINKSKRPALYLMSSKKVFEQWLTDVAPGIQEMAGNEILRLVSIDNIERDPNAENYWIVAYSLTTWPQPNNFAAMPIVEHDVIYMRIIYEPDIRLQIITNAGDEIPVEEILEQGEDPAVAFKFYVSNISTYKE